jgi:WD40 repeat protein
MITMANGRHRPDPIPAAPAFSRDESQLIVGQRGDSALVQVKVYDTALGQFQLKSTYYDHDAEVVAAALLQDGSAVSAGGDQNAIHFWDPTYLKGKRGAEIKGVGRVVHAVGLNPDEQIGIGNHDDLRLDDNIVLRRVFDLHGMPLKALSIDDSQRFSAHISAPEHSGWNGAMLTCGCEATSDLILSR